MIETTELSLHRFRHWSGRIWKGGSLFSSLVWKSLEGKLTVFVTGLEESRREAHCFGIIWKGSSLFWNFLEGKLPIFNFHDWLTTQQNSQNSELPDPSETVKTMRENNSVVSIHQSLIILSTTRAEPLSFRAIKDLASSYRTVGRKRGIRF